MTRHKSNLDDYIPREEDKWKVEQGAVCKSCGGFKIQPENVWFDEHGTSYVTKLTRCPNCNKIIIIKHIEDYGFSRLNSDIRYF